MSENENTSKIIRGNKGSNEAMTQLSSNINESVLETKFQLPQIINDVIPNTKLRRHVSKIELNRKMTMKMSLNKISASNPIIKTSELEEKSASFNLKPQYQKNLKSTSSETNKNKSYLNPKEKYYRKLLPLEYIKIKIIKKSSILEMLKPHQIERIMENLGHDNKNLKPKNPRMNLAHKITNYYNELVYNSTTPIYNNKISNPYMNLSNIDKNKCKNDYLEYTKSENIIDYA
ncbi:hypothetical protein SteCoe_13269 [Stentor coeruleus]|uniref:Uncharacterized protein n=1 Tax=Stentor coeruleus TaxID=5963 RepID=A0A1R2C8V2_9CILI|nr:hypothetical protein SteCoe_13269 [Stentor coeruleus]